MLRVEGLGKRYDTRWLFRGISFTMEPGQCLAILGPNGCGKSTLLKTLVGLVSPTEGQVFHAGDLRTTIGYSALDLFVYPLLTGKEHLTIAAGLRGCDPRHELLEELGLGAAMDLPAKALSSGQRARLKMALALQADPPLLMLDEPGASLDAAGRELIRGIRARCEKGLAIIIATNDPGERSLATHELELA